MGFVCASFRGMPVMKSFEMLYVQLSVGRSSQRAALRPIFRLPIMLLAVFCLMVANILFAPKAFATEFLVNTTTANGQSTPVIAELVGGGFVITWRDDSQTGGDTSDGAIRAQRYDANGVAQGGEFLVNTTTVSTQFGPSIAGLVGDGFVIAWVDFSQTGGDTDSAAVRAQRYDANGLAQGAEFLVNTTTANDQGSSSIAGLSDGGFVITWAD